MVLHLSTAAATKWESTEQQRRQLAFQFGPRSPIAHPPPKKGVKNLSLYLGICLFDIVYFWGYLTARLTNTKKRYLLNKGHFKWGI